MKYQAIVVLAGGFKDNGELPQNVKYRVLTAYKLYKQGLAPRIIMSGKWSPYWDHSPPKQTEAEMMSRYARSLGVPNSAIFNEEHSQNTSENIFYTYKIFLEPNNWRSIIIVTSDYHVRRTKQILRRTLDSWARIRVIGSPTRNTFSKRLQLYTKELIMLYTDWFLQHFLNRK